MANRKVTMTHLRAIIREFKLGTPMREIERKLKISRTSLRPYKERAESSGKSMDELLKMVFRCYLRLEHRSILCTYVHAAGHKLLQEVGWSFYLQGIT